MSTPDIDWCAAFMREQTQAAKNLARAEAAEALNAEVARVLEPFATFPQPTSGDRGPALSAWGGPKQWTHLPWEAFEAAAALHARLSAPSSKMKQGASQP